MTKKTTPAIEERTRPATRPACRATDRFDELLAAATPSSWDNLGGAPSSAHARLDQILNQHRTFDDERWPGGDVDDALVQLVDRASSSLSEATQRQAASQSRPTWIVHDLNNNWVVDRAGGNAICLHYLSGWRSLALVSFVEHSDPLIANAVIEDLLKDNLFATVRPEIAHSLLNIALERRSRISPAVLNASTQAIAATDLLSEKCFGLLINQEGYEERSVTFEAIFLSAAASFRWWSIAQQRYFTWPSDEAPVAKRSAIGWRPRRGLTPGQQHCSVPARCSPSVLRSYPGRSGPGWRGDTPETRQDPYLGRVRALIGQQARRLIDALAITLTTMAVNVFAYLME